MAKLLVWTKAHGDDGLLTVRAPGRGLQSALQVSSFEEILEVCDRLPNVEADQSEGVIEIQFNKWTEYQSLSDGAGRMRRYRQRKKDSERDATGDEHCDDSVT